MGTNSAITSVSARAIETLVYLYEVERVRSVSDLITAAGGAVSNRAYGNGVPVDMVSNHAYGKGEPVGMDSNRAYEKGEPVGALSKRAYGNINSEILAAGVPPSENAWPKYAFKLATGTGKTKCMSLANRLELFPRAARAGFRDDDAVPCHRCPGSPSTNACWKISAAGRFLTQTRSFHLHGKATGTSTSSKATSRAARATACFILPTSTSCIQNARRKEPVGFTPSWGLR